METENLLSQFKNNEIDFKQLVDAYKNTKDYANEPCLYMLFWNTKLFEELIQNNRLNKEDIKYLLNKIDKNYELWNLCDNPPLIKEILNEFILNKELVDKFNTILENYWKDIHTIFDVIEFHTTYECDDKEEEYYERDEDEIDQELLKLNELNKYVYSFDLNVDQHLDLIEVLKDNEIAQNKLIQIVDNHLENSYDFESLMNYLKKQEKKTILNI